MIIWWWRAAFGAPVGDPGTVDEVLACFASEPDIQQVQRWADEAAHTSPARIRRWLRQSSSSAALPELTLDLRLRTDWDEGFDYTDAFGAEALPEDEVVAVPRDFDRGATQEAKIRLRWQLDELVMSSDRIRVVNEAQDLVKLRERVLSEVTRLYFERRRLQVEMLLAPRIDLQARTGDELRLAELTASIDALTGGAFSARR